MTTYDKNCYALACWFLQDEPILDKDRHRHALASHIQSEIEHWIEFEREEAEIERKRSEEVDPSIDER